MGLTEQEKEELIEKIQKLAKTKKIQNQFNLMLDDYVEIAQFIVQKYGIENMTQIMERTFVRPFKNHDVVSLLKKKNNSAGLHAFYVKTKKKKNGEKIINIFSRISINPYPGEQDKFIVVPMHQHNERKEDATISDSKQTPTPLVIIGKNAKYEYDLDPKLIEKGFWSLYHRAGNGEKDENIKEVLTVLTHEIIHSTASYQIIKKPKKQLGDLHAWVGADGNLLFTCLGGTTNEALHEGMTEFFTTQIVYNNRDYYGLSDSRNYQEKYFPYVQYVRNMHLLFPEGIKDMYFHGIDNIGKHKTDYVTLKELVADFELMDNAVKALQEKAARPQNITESDLKDFEIIKKVWEKQTKFFDKLLEDGKISQATHKAMKDNLFDFVRYSFYKESYNMLSVSLVDENLELKSGFSLAYLLKEKKRTEKELLDGLGLKDLFDLQEVKKGSIECVVVPKVKNPKKAIKKSLFLESFCVTKRKDLALLPIKDEKLYDKEMFENVVVLEDGIMGFTDYFEDMKLNGYNTDGAIKIQVKDGVVSVFKNMFYDDDYVSKTIYDEYAKEWKTMQDFETPAPLSPEQTVALLNVLKVLDISLLDAGIAPNIELDEVVMQKYFELESKNKEEKMKKEIEKENKPEEKDVKKEKRSWISNLFKKGDKSFGKN